MVTVITFLDLLILFIAVAHISIIGMAREKERIESHSEDYVIIFTQ